MGLTLNLGVIDLPYTDSVKGTTTGKLAGWLENKYHPMLIFYLDNEAKVDGWLGDALEGAIETLLQSGHMPSPSSDVFASGTTKIEAAFKEFLSLSVIETLNYPGVPTKAALQGVNHRLKRKSGPRRPSLIDTGLYQSAFKAWVS